MYDREPEQIYEVACSLVRQGVSVIPTGGGISHKAKQPHYTALSATGHTYTRADGKVCGSWKAMQTALPTLKELEVWFLQQRARGLGMVTGRVSGYVVVDVDVEGLPLLRELGWEPHVISPSGGAHLYLKHPGWLVQSNASKNQKALPEGFDVRGDGGYIMFPPSRNRKGQYRRTDVKKPLGIDDIPEHFSAGGQEYRLREALGLTPPQPQDDQPAPSFTPFYAADDDRCPLPVILDRAADYASVSRNKGAFMLGLWGHANGYRLDETLYAAQDYTDMVRGTKRTPFTVEEAQRAIQSAYRYPRIEAWKRKEEMNS